MLDSHGRVLCAAPICLEKRGRLLREGQHIIALTLVRAGPEFPHGCEEAIEANAGEQAGWAKDFIHQRCARQLGLPLSGIFDDYYVSSNGRRHRWPTEEE